MFSADTLMINGNKNGSSVITYPAEILHNFNNLSKDVMIKF